jgi:transposase InsO family protein
MSDETHTPARVRWARLRFQIIGQLLAAPPDAGELAQRIAELAQRPWRHPTTGEVVRFSAKTIERWYYAARDSQDPMRALERKVPKHAGTHPSVSDAVAVEIRALRRDHPRWSYKLVHDNLVVIARENPALQPLPGYASVCRYMKHHGLGKRRKPRRHELEPTFVQREQRSYAVSHVHALWHFDFHQGRRAVALPSGELVKPVLLGILDDHSRLCCHAQWYLDAENTEWLVHGLCQALAKRGLPRAVLSDNGAPMLAAETREGLERLSIVQHTTLPQTPQQNGKQESFWTRVEGRLMPMLEGEPELSLELLNRATQAWVEQEYQRSVHGETGQTPLERALSGPSVVRSCPSSDALRRAFRMEVRRKQRKSDGTITVEGVRYELLSAYRTLEWVNVRVARWDLSSIDLVDPRTGTHLATLLPLDREKNADGRRRPLPDCARTRDDTHEIDGAEQDRRRKPAGIAPLLRQLMADYAATGLPPAYVPHNERAAVLPRAPDTQEIES